MEIWVNLKHYSLLDPFCFLLISHFFFHFYELSIHISLKIKTIRAFQIKNSVTPCCLQLRSKFCGNKILFKKKICLCLEYTKRNVHSYRYKHLFVSSCESECNLKLNPTSVIYYSFTTYKRYLPGRQSQDLLLRREK